MKFRGNGQSSESGELCMSSSYLPRGPLKQLARSGLLIDVEGCGGMTWTYELIRLDRQARYLG